MRRLHLVSVLAMASCGTISQREPDPVLPSTTPAIAEQPAAPVAVRPAALWKGQAIEWSELQPLLSERAGASTIEEVMLGRQLDALLKERNLVIDDALLRAEQQQVLDSLSDNADRSERLLLELRAVQGLGERRWNNLLRRNAAARRLVADQVHVTHDAIEAALDASHWARRRCRVMALPDLRQCAEAKRRIESGEPFGEVAASVSTDRSAARGGLVNPVSRLDPTWPSAFRQTLWSLQPHGVSSPVLVDSGYVLIQLEEELPASTMDAAMARVKAERDVRRGQERVQMEALLSGLRQAQHDVVLFDASLQDGWDRVKNASK